MIGNERNLYIVITRGCGTFYVVAKSWNMAEEAVKKTLDDCDFGYSDGREVQEIKLLRKEHYFNNKPFLCGDHDINKFIIIEEPSIEISSDGTLNHVLNS